MQEIIKEISFVKMSKHRQKVLISLKDNELKLPSEITKDTKLVFSDVSRSLKSLKEKKLVLCLNEDDNQGRLYQITNKGKEVLKHIK
ncbi:MAG: MarR family transcriptional regulator [Methanobrevibacter sp.]|nr:MarR family transcriptional regulator [Methanobrevibacter sp.]MCL2157676.1 MarR family transcriptional regulator [Methanobrevibacter sp.]